jgi:hypothetical protein
LFRGFDCSVLWAAAVAYQFKKYHRRFEMITK